MAETSRQITWVDPLITRDLVASMSGLDALRAMLDGGIPHPPISHTLDFRLVEVEPGTVTVECTPDEYHYNPIGAVHGGLTCALLDTVTGCAGHTTLAAGQGYTTIEITVKYLRPVLAGGGVLTAVGTVTKPGRRVIFADGTVHDEAGRLVATASSSLLVL